MNIEALHNFILDRLNTSDPEVAAKEISDEVNRMYRQIPVEDEDNFDEFCKIIEHFANQNHPEITETLEEFLEVIYEDFALVD